MVADWRPIATIPEWVDVLTAGGNGGIVIRRLFYTDPDPDDGTRCPFWYRGPDMDEGADDDPPTHWMPLPEAP